MSKISGFKITGKVCKKPLELVQVVRVRDSQGTVMLPEVGRKSPPLDLVSVTLDAQSLVADGGKGG